MNRAPSVTHIDRLELTFAPKSWTFANERRADIDAFFELMRKEKPTIWNGRVLLMHQQVLNAGVLRGEYLETDYASFAAWRHWGRPPAGVSDCFGAGAIVARDGAVLLGVMGVETINAGLIYFPCGTPDPEDIVDGKVDLDLSVRRELKEETGLDVAEFESEPGWTMIVDGPLIAQIKVLRSNESSTVLRDRALVHLASELHPELADIRIVRGAADIDRAMPRFVTAFLLSRFAGGAIVGAGETT
jgi:8-oxo-dGTP pyrophosphatase MutT (NUDIX family)